MVHGILGPASTDRPRALRDRDRPDRPQRPPISKAGNRLLRTTLYRAADNARRVDSQPTRSCYYHLQMVKRGKTMSVRSASSLPTSPNELGRS